MGFTKNCLALILKIRFLRSKNASGVKSFAPVAVALIFSAVARTACARAPANTQRRFHRSASTPTSAPNMPRSVTLPCTLGVDPLRTHQPENREQPVSPIYAWVFVTERAEGLVMAIVGTLLAPIPTTTFPTRKKSSVSSRTAGSPPRWGRSWRARICMSSAKRSVRRQPAQRRARSAGNDSQF